MRLDLRKDFADVYTFLSQRVRSFDPATNDGTRQELPVSSSGQLATAVGEMLRGVLLKARGEGVFAGLPKASRCEPGVEEQDGDYGWPAYESRGADNLA